MKRCLAAATAVALLFPVSLRSQSPRPRPPAPTAATLDSARAAVFDAVAVLHDSMQTVLAAAARLERGGRNSSDSWLLSRARAMTAGCSRSGRVLGPTREALARGAWESPYARQTQAALLSAVDDLDHALATCVTRWEPRTRGERLAEARESGRNEAREVRNAILFYERSLAVHFKALDIQGSPRTGHAAPAPAATVEKP